MGIFCSVNVGHFQIVSTTKVCPRPLKIVKNFRYEYPTRALYVHFASRPSNSTSCVCVASMAPQFL